MLHYSQPPTPVFPDYVIKHLGPLPPDPLYKPKAQMRAKDAEGAFHLLNYRDQELTLEHFWKFGSKGPFDKLRDPDFRLRRGMRS
jgi:hypothetical protein